jgi:hypothetical protein
VYTKSRGGPKSLQRSCITKVMYYKGHIVTTSPRSSFNSAVTDMP